MDRDAYLNRLMLRLQFLPAEKRAEIRRELETHLAEREEEARAAGLSDASATQAALTAFGDAEGHADSLRRVWRSWQWREHWRQLGRILKVHRTPRRLAMSGGATITLTTTDDVNAFWREFSQRVDAGDPLVRCLNDLAANRSGDLRSAIEDINQELQAGNPLSHGMKKYPSLFPADQITVIRQGEIAGRLEDALRILWRG